jgi:hypothetical protein
MNTGPESILILGAFLLYTQLFCQFVFLFPHQNTIIIAKHTKVDMIWVAGRSPTLVSYSLRGVAMNLKATTLTYLAILCG